MRCELNLQLCVVAYQWWYNANLNKAVFRGPTIECHVRSRLEVESRLFLPKSPQVVLGTSRRLEVDLGSLYTKWGRIGTLKYLPGLDLSRDGAWHDGQLSSRCFLSCLL